MSTTCIVQARMGSTRLPGKVLMELAGRPMLQLMLERLASAPVDQLVVATSVDERDDPIVDLCAQLGVSTTRGSESDVLGRFVTALDDHPADTVVRLTADCPLSDPTLVGAVIARHWETGADYTSNTLVRMYPDGLDVEVVRAEALRAAAHEATNAAEREHVTPFIYRRPTRFALAVYSGPSHLGMLRWTVDRPQDIDWLRALVARVADPVTSRWEDLLDASTGLGSGHADDFTAVELTPLALSMTTEAGWVRRWIACSDGRAIGEIEVVVDDGVGHLVAKVDDPHGVDSQIALIRALSADLQVRELVGPADELIWSRD